MYTNNKILEIVVSVKLAVVDMSRSCEVWILLVQTELSLSLTCKNNLSVVNEKELPHLQKSDKPNKSKNRNIDWCQR